MHIFCRTIGRNPGGSMARPDPISRSPTLYHFVNVGQTKRNECTALCLGPMQGHAPDDEQDAQQLCQCGHLAQHQETDGSGAGRQ